MKKFLVFGSMFMLPALAMAQEKGLAKVLDTFGDLLSTLSALLFGAAVVAFFYGVAKFIFSTGNDGKAEGKSIMVWGIIGIFVMSAVYGLVGILADTFEVGGEDDINVPTLPSES